MPCIYSPSYDSLSTFATEDFFVVCVHTCTRVFAGYFKICKKIRICISRQLMSYDGTFQGGSGSKP